MKYSGRWFQRETVHVSGDVIDGDVYPVFQAPGKRRKKCRPTSAIQERLNQRNAERKLTRILNTNFSEQDYALHLTYRDGALPETEEEAKKAVTNYLRRAKRRYRAAGIELRYVYVTERSESSGRWHHHLILTGGVNRDELEDLWQHGRCNADRLKPDDDGLAGLARYVTKARRQGLRCTYRRWTGSRNLLKPEEIQRDGALTAEDVAEAAEAIEEGTGHVWLEARYPGYRCVSCEVERNAVNRGVYIRYTMRADALSLQRRRGRR